MTSDGEATKDIKCRIAKASRAICCKSVFDNKALSIRTKREVYIHKGVVLAVLGHGSETWVLKDPTCETSLFIS